ncbi:hypothetical protein IVB18_05330 [Bradyrhizobium sp. 186]|uniref:hypothetical protein n=1 Tax=Bradyrhizobium sp. 186 TaxID=2782654 RepID=UPI0020008F64|nr:hypothetical protein [Bradyrhizobium sp. 186]UPK31874.1 hypothetical protein IVB18_26470 [Bradyrhizobium sp. 186]UPK36772.1 hypothetical protein IVB18_05330 [Bradyrhizobium sp. 186]
MARRRDERGAGTAAQRDRALGAIMRAVVKAVDRPASDAAIVRDAPMLAYDRGRRELMQAVAVDEVKTIRDQAEALRRYWAQRHDKEMEAACSAIRLRADYEIGVRSKALEGTSGQYQSKSPPSGDLGKESVLREAGIAPQRAREFEKLTEIITEKDVDRLCREAHQRF